MLATVYDGLGRKAELHDKAPDGPLRAKWVYDTVTGAKGQLAESTRYLDGKAYTTKITQYDPVYRPLRTDTVIPDSEGALAGTYSASTSLYVNGLPRGRSVSQAGNIFGKGWNYTYDDRTMRVTSVFGSGIRSDATYTLTGKPLTYKIFGSGKPTQVTNTYEWGTQRLSNARVDRQDVAGVDQSATYGYDPAGNVTSLSDISRSGTDTQCFTYDYLRRLTEAWTQDEKTCADKPAGNLIAGPAPYWQSYGYDTAGNRTTLTQHDPTGDTAKDTKSTYTYPKPGTPQPHTLTAVDSTSPTGTNKNTYGYDNSGNTTTRTLTGDKQTLTWDAEGHLTKVSEPVGDKGTKATSYVHDADGNRLITRTDDRTTLTLGDHTEVTLDKGADKPKATRYIPLGSGHQAVLTDDGTYTITLADRLGTGQLAINAADQTLTQRRQLPFGGPRGTKPTNWPGSKGYIGGTNDTADTGLTHLGAREYDTETGRFISVDPVLDPVDPQQINGYTYGNNNPLTFSDPTGKTFANPDGSGGTGVVHNSHGGMRLSGSKDYIPGPGACIQPYCHTRYNGPIYRNAGQQAAAQYMCGCERPERLVFQEGPQSEWFSPDSIAGKVERGDWLGALHRLWSGPPCRLGELCEDMAYGVMPIVPGGSGGPPRPIPQRAIPSGPGLRTISEAKLSPNDARRIQNAADKIGYPIIVVGSRAGTKGGPNPTSDWDYILSGPSRARGRVKNSLPRGSGDGEGSGRGRDFFQRYNPSRPDYSELDPTRPHVIFQPRER